MKRGILYYVVEIVFVIMLVIFTGYIVNNNSLNSVDIDFIKDNNLAINYHDNSDVLMPMSDSYAMNNIDKSVINVTNYNSDDIEYKLFMRVKKDKDLDFNQLKVMLNDDIFRLYSKYDYEDSNYLYFDLAHQKVNNINNVNFAMWLDKSVDNSSLYSFSYNFYIERI